MTLAGDRRFIRRNFAAASAFPRCPRLTRFCCADLPPHSRTLGKRAGHLRHGGRGRLHFRPVRGRRRLPADTAPDLLRHSAGGFGRHRRAADRRLVGLGGPELLAAAADRPEARNRPAAGRHRRQQHRRAGLQRAALVGPARPHRVARLRHLPRPHRRADAQRVGARHDQRAARAAGAAAPPRPAQLGARPALQDALQEVAALRQRHPDHRARRRHRLSRRAARHRRRLHHGAGADLPPARADQRGHRHVAGPDRGDHGGGDGPARDVEPVGRPDPGASS